MFLSIHCTQLNSEEEQELEALEEIDDYLSFLNRIVRNLSLTQNEGIGKT